MSGNETRTKLSNLSFIHHNLRKDHYGPDYCHQLQLTSGSRVKNTKHLNKCFLPRKCSGRGERFWQLEADTWTLPTTVIINIPQGFIHLSIVHPSLSHAVSWRSVVTPRKWRKIITFSRSAVEPQCPRSAARRAAQDLVKIKAKNFSNIC